MSDIQIGMVDPWGQVVRECGHPKITQKSIALTYAFGLRQLTAEEWAAPCAPEVKAANVAIMERFGAKGLARVKDLAWAYFEGRKSPVSRG